MGDLSEQLAHGAWQKRLDKEHYQMGRALLAQFSKEGQKLKSRGEDIFNRDNHHEVAPCHDLYRTWTSPVFLPDIQGIQPRGPTPDGSRRMGGLARQTMPAGWRSHPRLTSAAAEGAERPQSVAAGSVASHRRLRSSQSASVFTASVAASSLRSQVTKVVEDEVAKTLKGEFVAVDSPSRARPRQQFASRRERLQAMLADAKPPNRPRADMP